MRGLARFYRFERQANEEALRLFKSAIKLDPDFASAFGRAACCYSFAHGLAGCLSHRTRLQKSKS